MTNQTELKPDEGAINYIRNKHEYRNLGKDFIYGLVNEYLHLARTSPTPPSSTGEREVKWEKCTECKEMFITAYGPTKCINCHLVRRGPWSEDLDSVAFGEAWEAWLSNADAARMDRDSALKGAIVVYLREAARSHDTTKTEAGVVERVARALKPYLPSIDFPSESTERIFQKNRMDAAKAAISEMPQAKVMGGNIVAEEITPCPYVTFSSKENQNMNFMVKRYDGYFDYIEIEDGLPVRCIRVLLAAQQKGGE